MESSLSSPIGLQQWSLNDTIINSPYKSQNQNQNHSHVKVVTRVRPFSENEINLPNNRRIVAINDKKIVLVNPTAWDDADPDIIAEASTFLHLQECANIFKFDSCFWSFDSAQPNYSTQEDIYRSIGSEIVENALNGISSSCFAYGQTGTGEYISFISKLNVIQ